MIIYAFDFPLVHRLDVTEAQFGIMIVHIVGGIFGPGIFSSQVNIA